MVSRAAVLCASVHPVHSVLLWVERCFTDRKLSATKSLPRNSIVHYAGGAQPCGNNSTALRRELLAFHALLMSFTVLDANH